MWFLEIWTTLGIWGTLITVFAKWLMGNLGNSQSTVSCHFTKYGLADTTSGIFRNRNNHGHCTSGASKVQWMYTCMWHLVYMQRPKEKLFVSCNPTLFYSKETLPHFYSALPTANQHKTCINHTFLTKKIIPPNFFLLTYLPYLLLYRFRKQTLFFLGQILNGLSKIRWF